MISLLLKGEDVTRMYERVVLVRPVPLDFDDDVMGPGSHATIVDLVDEGVVILEFDLDAPDLVGGKRFQTALATVYDFAPVR